jgi:CubicO group peptidase (beta-lactamase class C family)
MKRRQFLFTTSALLAATWSRQMRGAQPPDDNIDDVLNSVRKEHDLPAVAGAVINKGQIIYGAVGVRKAGDETPVTRDDPFHLGSCTKSMTATLAGMLVEEGKLKWESTLAEMLPDLAERMQEVYRPVTLEQLLAHRAGLWPNTGLLVGAKLRLLVGADKPDGSLREQRMKFVERILQDDPVHPPGTQFAYSNSGFITAGAILERLTDMAWEDLMRKRIFEPLEITTAGFGAMGTPGEIDAPWQHQIVLGFRVPVEPSAMADNPPLLGPAGTVHCSVGDWAKYILDHLRGESGQGKLLKAETYQRLHTPAPGENYVGGWVILERKWGGGKVIFHNGSNTVNYAVAWLAPLRDAAFLAMTNQGGATAPQACDQVVAQLIRRFLRED